MKKLAVFLVLFFAAELGAMHKKEPYISLRAIYDVLYETLEGKKLTNSNYNELRGIMNSPINYHAYSIAKMLNSAFEIKDSSIINEFYYEKGDKDLVFTTESYKNVLSFDKSKPDYSGYNEKIKIKIDALHNLEDSSVKYLEVFKLDLSLNTIVSDLNKIRNESFKKIKPWSNLKKKLIGIGSFGGACWFSSFVGSKFFGWSSPKISLLGKLSTGFGFGFGFLTGMWAQSYRVNAEKQENILKKYIILRAAEKVFDDEKKLLQN